MGQAIPKMFESEVLPHVFAMDHEPGKVSLYIDDDPGGKAHEEAQSETCEARSPEHARVLPEPNPEQGQESEPVDVVEPEPDPCGESQEGRERQRAPLIGEHSEEEKHGQRRKQERFPLATGRSDGVSSQQRWRETK